MFWRLRTIIGSIIHKSFNQGNHAVHTFDESADPVWHIGVLVAVGVKLKFTFCFCSMVIPRYEMSRFYRIFHSYASVIDDPVIRNR